MKVVVEQEYDETGELEELTWDLIPVVSATKTTHLDSSGLPKVGTVLEPGMPIVGKIGKTKAYDAASEPDCLELHGLRFEELQEKYGHMWRDSSLYATEAMTGVVTEAYWEPGRHGLRAVVVIDPISAKIR